VKRITFAFVVLALGLVAALSVSASPAAPASPKLTATVGPGFTISLKQGSAKVKTLKAGTYTIAVSDKSSSHDFHLSGPGVNKKTSIGKTGKATWTVKFQKGKTYRYVCDAHVFEMRGSFKVT
jgi:plastocyanin